MNIELGFSVKIDDKIMKRGLPIKKEALNEDRIEETLNYCKEWLEGCAEGFIVYYKDFIKNK